MRATIWKSEILKAIDKIKVKTLNQLSIETGYSISALKDALKTFNINIDTLKEE